MQLESRAETDAVGVVVVHSGAAHVAVAEGSAPRVASIALRRRPTPGGKSFVFIITLRNS